MLWQYNKSFKKNIAFKFYDHNSLVEVTYEEFERRCEIFSSQLPNNKSLVLICADNSIESLIALFGTLNAQHTVLLADHDNSQLTETLTKRYHPDFTYKRTDSSWSLINNHQQRVKELHPSLALLLSTSGSSGSPKCVRLSYENIASNAAAICDYLPISEKDITALTLPSHYSFGLSIINSHLYAGACTFIGDISISSPDFLRFLQKEKITSIAGVPYSFEVFERQELRKEKLPALKYITQAGGKLNETIIKKYAQWAIDSQKLFYVMYGQTEAAPRISYVPPEWLLQNPNCIGKPIPDGKLSIINEAGGLVTTHDTPGELVYEGPNVMLGYARSADDLTKGKEVDQLKTGDIACYNKHNLFYITGRKKRFTKIYGKRLNLDEIESFLSPIESGITCVSNDKTLFLCATHEITSDIKNTIHARFGISEFDIHIVKTESIPLLASNKIDYLSLTELSENSLKSTLKKNNTTNEEGIQKLYQATFPHQKINKKSNFSELGGDSLNYISVSIGLEKILGTLPSNWNTLNIQQLSTLLKRKSNLAISSIETTILIRAYAIVAVVLNHSGLKTFAGGAAVLLLVFGMNTARFQYNNLLNNKTDKLLTTFVKHVLIPYWVLIFSYSIIKFTELPELRHILLFSNIVVSPTDKGIDLWFVSAITHMLLILIIIFRLSNIRKFNLAKNNSNLLGYLFLAISIVITGLNLLLGFSDGLVAPRQHSFFIIWIFSLGIYISIIQGKTNKMMALLLVILLSAIFYSNDITRIISLTICGTLLIYTSDIKVPTFTIKPIQIISSASLFIYFLHGRAPIDSYTSFWPVDLIRIGFGLLLGIVFWFIYNHILKFIEGYYSRKRERAVS